MPFASESDAYKRLVDNSAPLSQQENADLLPWLRVLGEGPLRILWAQLALANMKAIKEFDESSSKLTKRIYWLTWALVALTVVIAVFTVLLWRVKP